MTGYMDTSATNLEEYQMFPMSWVARPIWIFFSLIFFLHGRSFHAIWSPHHALSQGA